MSTSPPNSSLNAESFIGQRIDKYRIVRLLGEGGMGMVFEAANDSVGARVAIKILRPEVAGRSDVVNRFFNEARAANAIDHPGIVRVFDSGYMPSGAAYLAMEFLNGTSLRHRFDRTPRLLLSEIMYIGRQVAAALHAAHRAGVIHRDLKPDNIMLIPDPDMAGGMRVKVLDFGIAKITESSRLELAHTKTNALMGTPQYMSPEQCKGAKTVTERSDVYALGVILYELLAGQRPFEADHLGALLVLHMTESARPLVQVVPGLDPRLAQLVHLMLDKQPATRPTMEMVAQALQGLAELEPRRASGLIPVFVAPAPSGTSVPSRPSHPGIPIPVPGQFSGPAPGAIEAEDRTKHISLAGISAQLPIPPSAKTPRTVTGSASESISPRPRRKWLAAALGGGVGLCALGLLWNFLPGAGGGADSRARLDRLDTRGATQPLPRAQDPKAAANPESGIDPALREMPRELPTDGVVEAGEPLQPKNVRTAKPTDGKLQLAREAFRRGQYTVAVTKAMDVAERYPLEAWTLIGKTACHTNSPPLIKHSIAMIAKQGPQEASHALDEIDKECGAAGLVRGPDLQYVLRAEEPKNGADYITQSNYQYNAGHFQNAIDIADKVKISKSADAWEVIGKSACALKKLDKADKALEELSSQSGRVAAVIKACEKYHVVLERKKFVAR